MQTLYVVCASSVWPFWSGRSWRSWRDHSGWQRVGHLCAECAYDLL